MNSKQSNLNLQALLVPTVVAVAGLLFGCSDSPEPYQVEYVAPGAGGGVIPPADCDPPCRSGFSCVQGACVSSCNPDCPAGSLCVNGECETECNPPCSSGYSCVARVCTGSSDVQIYDYEEGNKPSEYGTFGTTWPKMSLTYSIANTPPGMSQEDVVAAVASATSKWHAVCLGLTFTPISGDNADIKFLFASLDHGDGVPFDGKGHILAHAFSPGEGRGGDVHFDSDETWTGFSSSGKTNLAAVALHELGHSLGLDHSNEINSIMYPYYRLSVTELQPDDIAGISHLYNCTSSDPGGCGNGACETSLGEDCSSCPDDCGCSGNTQCDNGVCVSACSNQCGPDQTQCDGNAVMSCTAVNGCYQWTTTQTCGSGEVCDNGHCTATCSNACTMAQTQCSGNTVQSCSLVNGCYVWTTTQTCGSSQTCQNGQCTTSCSASGHWNPSSGSDLDIDGTQYNNGLVPLVGTGIRMEVAESSGGGLRLRACKVENAKPNLSGPVHAYMRSFEGYVMFDQVLSVDSSTPSCTVWGDLNNENNYATGAVLNASWRVVSPASSAGYWTYSCTKGGSADPTGTCFWDTHIQPMTRTCK